MRCRHRVPAVAQDFGRAAHAASKGTYGAPRLRIDRKRREASTVIFLADFGIGWIARLNLLTSAALDVGLCSASSMARPPDVD